TIVDPEGDGAISIEVRFHAIRCDCEIPPTDLPRVLRKLVGLDEDPEALAGIERRDQPCQSDAEPPEHALRPRGPQAPQAEHRPGRVKPVGGTELPAAPDIGKHEIVRVELVPVKDRVHLVRIATNARDELEAGSKLVRGETSDTLLAENTPATRSEAGV